MSTMQSNVCVCVCVLVLDRIDSYSSRLLSITSSNICISQGFNAVRHKLALLITKVYLDIFLFFFFGTQCR